MAQSSTKFRVTGWQKKSGKLQVLKIGNFSTANKTIRRGIMFVSLRNVDSSLQKFTWMRNRGDVRQWNTFLKSYKKLKLLFKK